MKLLSDLYNVTLKRGIEGAAKGGFVRPTIGENFMSHRDFQEIESSNFPLRDYNFETDTIQDITLTEKSNSTDLFGSLSSDTYKWFGGVLAPNGKIYGIPRNSTQVLEIDPTTKTTTLFGSLSSDIRKWYGGVLAPNGKIYGIPWYSTQVLEIDPSYTVGQEIYHWALSAYVNKY